MFDVALSFDEPGKIGARIRETMVMMTGGCEVVKTYVPLVGQSIKEGCFAKERHRECAGWGIVGISEGLKQTDGRRKQRERGNAASSERFQSKENCFPQKVAPTSAGRKW